MERRRSLTAGARTLLASRPQALCLLPARKAWALLLEERGWVCRRAARPRRWSLMVVQHNLTMLAQHP